MKEIVVTAKLVKKFCQVPMCYAKKRHSGKFGSGDPDFNGCFRGKAFYIETKLVTGELSELQAAALDRWYNAGATTAMFVYDPIRQWLQWVYPEGYGSWETLTGAGAVRAALASAHAGVMLREFDALRWMEDNLR